MVRCTVKFDWAALQPSIPFLLQGALTTLEYAYFSVLFGLLWGTLLSLMKLSQSKILTSFANAYTSIFRGTPLLVQLMLIYYCLPQLTGYTISAYGAGILTFGLNSGAYISEIMRASISSIDRGQFEAFASLGISYYQGMKDIILPQALRRSLPSLVNEMIDMVKESSIISVIGEMDLLRRAQMVATEKYIYFEPFIAVAVVYFVIIKFLTFWAKRFELWIAQSDHS